MKSDQREFAVFICAQIGLGALTWWVSSQAWRVSLTEAISEDLGTTVTESGSQIAPILSVNGVVSIVAVLGIIATKTWGRRVIGILAAIVSAITVVSLIGANSAGIGFWIAISVGLAVGLVLTNLWAVARGSNWPILGRKYERQSLDHHPTDPWKALDQGIDPTLD